MSKTPSRVPQFLSVRAVADRLAVSTKTIRRWIKRGDLRPHYFGGQVRISEDDVANFIAARRQ